jgi:hypothetical protein
MVGLVEISYSLCIASLILIFLFFCFGIFFRDHTDKFLAKIKK